MIQVDNKNNNLSSPGNSLLLEGLGKVPRKETIPILYLRLLIEPDWYVRKTLLNTVSSSKSSKVIEMALIALQDEDPEVRKTALKIVKQLDKEAVLAKLKSFFPLYNDNAKVRLIDSISAVIDADPLTARFYLKYLAASSDQEVKDLAAGYLKKTDLQAFSEAVKRKCRKASKTGWFVQGIAIVVCAFVLYFAAVTVAKTFFDFGPGPEENVPQKIASDNRGLLPATPKTVLHVPEGTTVETTARGTGKVKDISKGDADGDGKVTSNDLWQVKKHLLGVQGMPDGAQKATDLNNDAAVGTEDYTMMSLRLIEAGDVNRDGLVDGDDYNDLKRFLVEDRKDYRRIYDINADLIIDERDLHDLQKIHKRLGPAGEIPME